MSAEKYVERVAALFLSGDPTVAAEYMAVYGYSHIFSDNYEPGYYNEDDEADIRAKWSDLEWVKSCAEKDWHDGADGVVFDAIYAEVVGEKQSLPPEIRRLLVLSTAHITKKTCDGYRDWPLIAEHDHGCYFYVGDDSTLGEGAPDDLKRVVAYARKLGCHEIKFDCDADIIGGLPVYDW